MGLKTTFFIKVRRLLTLPALLLAVSASQAQVGVYAPFIDSSATSVGSKTYTADAAIGAAGTVPATGIDYRFGQAAGFSIQKRALKAFSAGGKRYALLVDASGTHISSTQVATNGNFTFESTGLGTL